MFNKKRLAILLFAIGLGFRAIIAVVQVTSGIHPIAWFPMVQPWSDFYTIYGRELFLLGEGSLSYRGLFTYTPLFLYTLFLFYHVGGIYFASVPILVADAATAPIIYLTVREISSNKVATLAGLSYALSPFMLIMEGYFWLSSQPMFLFMILAIYFLRRNRPLLSSLAIGIAIMFKQEAVFFLPVYVAWYVNRYKRTSWKGLLIFFMTVTAISLPFIITSPVAYLDSVSYGLVSKLLPSVTATLPLQSNQATLTTISNSSSVCSFVTAAMNDTSCNLGHVLYSTVNVSASYMVDSMVVILNYASALVQIPLLVFVAFILFFERKRENMLEVSCAYSSICFLLVFSFLVHEALAYYFLPVYGILFASSRSFSTISIIYASTFVSLFLSNGPVQTVLSLLTISIILASSGAKERKV